MSVWMRHGRGFHVIACDICGEMRPIVTVDEMKQFIVMGWALPGWVKAEDQRVDGCPRCIEPFADKYGVPIRARNMRG